ncbi:MAG: type III PLP-dependent enzyme [Candidatus Binatia bacterium]|nr:type III PLP-dependent enzyme [Candidatus Binatia bacterium]
MTTEHLAILQSVAQRFGTPCYVYFLDSIRERVALLKTAFEGLFSISYAVKSNPNLGLLRRIGGMVEYLDVSSAGEIARALRAGWPAAMLTFTGPGKTESELAFAVEVGVGEIVLESADEARVLKELVRRTGRRQRVLLRIAPERVPRGFGLVMGGRATPFGIDQEQLDETVAFVVSSPELELDGFHVFAASQCLRVEPLVEYYEIVTRLFRQTCERLHLSPRTFVFGSGLGIPYHPEESPLDLSALALRALPMLRQFAQWACARRKDATLVLETGRYLVGEAGVYLAGVTRIKRSHGQTIAICDGGMHQHLTAAGHLGGVIPRNFKITKVYSTAKSDGEQVYTLVGPLCTTLDTLARSISLPRLSPGDVIAVWASGAYGLTASPWHFISHPPPKEIVVESVSGESLAIDESDFGPLWWPAEASVAVANHNGTNEQQG